MVRRLALQVETSEPAVGEIEVYLLAQAPLGTDAETVVEQQLGIDGGSASGAVEGGQMPAQLEAVDSRNCNAIFRCRQSPSKTLILDVSRSKDC